MHIIHRVEVAGRVGYALRAEEGWRHLNGDPFGRYEPGAPITEKGVRVLAPVEPSKIVAVGLNYLDHAKEMNKPLPEEPLSFLKPSTAVIGSSDSIVVPVGVGRVDHEAELGVVMRRRAHRVTADRARDYILGLTCVNDVTARELQARDIQYTRAKGFDTFAPIGPGIAVGQNPDTLDVEGWVNGVRRQASNTRELIFGIDRLVAFISSIMTLLPGDVIATGTPSGVGPIVPGDHVVVKIEGVGELANEVVRAEEVVTGNEITGLGSSSVRV